MLGIFSTCHARESGLLLFYCQNFFFVLYLNLRMILKLNLHVLDRMMVALALFYTERHVEHHCHGEHCHVCHHLHHCLDLISEFCFELVEAPIEIICRCFLFRLVRFAVIILRPITLVSQKILLLN